MKLIYTEMSYSMTEILVNEARKAADQGYRVFYIAQILFHLKRKEKS